MDARMKAKAYGRLALSLALNFCLAVLYMLTGALAVVATPWRLVRRGSLCSDPEEKLGASAAPELFAMIGNIATMINSRKPMAVFLSGGARVYVRYASAFFPGRYALVIGSQLLRHCNFAEIRAAVADAMYATSRDISFALRWFVAAEGYLHDKAYGRGSVGQPGFLRLMRVRLYAWSSGALAPFVRSLTRECDARTARLFGTGYLCSAICKAEVVERFGRYYSDILSDFATEGRTIADYWTGYATVRNLSGDYFGFDFEQRDLLDGIPEYANCLPTTVDSGGCVEIGTRLSWLSKVDGGGYEGNLSAASTLVGDDVYARMSSALLSCVPAMRDGWHELATSRDFERWYLARLAARPLPTAHDLFLNREITPFPTKSVKPSPDNPFTRHNKLIMLDYLAAEADWDRMLVASDCARSSREVRYRHRSYASDSLPLCEHERYLSVLEAEVSLLDLQIYAYLLHKADDPDSVTVLYETIFEIDSIRGRARSCHNERVRLGQVLRSSRKGDSEVISGLARDVRELSSRIYDDVVSCLPWDMMAFYCEPGAFDSIKSYFGVARDFSGPDLSVMRESALLFSNLDILCGLLDYISQRLHLFLVDECRRLCPGDLEDRDIVEFEVPSSLADTCMSVDDGQSSGFASYLLRMSVLSFVSSRRWRYPRRQRNKLERAVTLMHCGDYHSAANILSVLAHKDNVLARLLLLSFPLDDDSLRAECGEWLYILAMASDDSQLMNAAAECLSAGIFTCPGEAKS